MKVWIIGGTSVAAIHAAKLFSEIGYSVISTTRLPFDKRLWPFEEKLLSNITFDYFDFHFSKKSMELFFEKIEPDLIINFGSMGMVDQSWDAPQDWLVTNILDLEKLLSVISSYKNIKYIHFSTPEVYGDHRQQVVENWNFMPSSPYALSRATGDHLVRLYGDQYGIDYNITRASSLYGEGQRLYRLIPKACSQALKRNLFQIQGDGNSVRDYVYAGDVAEALLLIADKASAKKVFHIGTNSFFSVVEILEIICEQASLDYSNFVEHIPGRRTIDLIYNLDCNAIKKLGWKPKIEFKSGINLVWDWVFKKHSSFDENDHIYNHVP